MHALEVEPGVAPVVGLGQGVEQAVQPLRRPDVVARHGLQVLAQRRAVQRLAQHHRAVGLVGPLHLPDLGITQPAVERAQGCRGFGRVERHPTVAAVARPLFAGRNQGAPDASALRARVDGQLVAVRRLRVAVPRRIGGPVGRRFLVGSADDDGAGDHAVQLGDQTLALGGTPAREFGRLGGSGVVHALRRQRGKGAVQQRRQRVEGVARGQRTDHEPMHLPAADHMRKTPKRGLSGIGALRLALRPSASTRRVSAGSMTPSSHSRALA